MVDAAVRIARAHAARLSQQLARLPIADRERIAADIRAAYARAPRYAQDAPAREIAR